MGDYILVGFCLGLGVYLVGCILYLIIGISK